MDKPEYEKLRDYLIDMGFEKGYKKGKSEVKETIVVDHEGLKKATEKLEKTHKKELMDLQDGYNKELKKLNAIYERRRNQDAEIVKKLKAEVEKLSK